MFVHGALVDGRLWEPVVDRLAGGARCVVPDAYAFVSRDQPDRLAELIRGFTA